MAAERGKRLSLYTRDYVVFDLETTGLSPEADEMIEISGIRVREGKAAEEFSTLVNPGRPIPYAASRVNGITDRMVREAPDLRDALGRFLAFIGEDVLVGHNIHTFYMLFLYNGAARALKRTVPNDYVDALYLAKSCLPGLYRYRLTDLAAHFGIDTQGAHRALKDCDMNRQCYECMGRILGSRAQSMGEMLRGARRRAWGEMLRGAGRRAWGEMLRGAGRRAWGEMLRGAGRRAWGECFGEQGQRNGGKLPELRRGPGEAQGEIRRVLGLQLLSAVQVYQERVKSGMKSARKGVHISI